MGVMACRLAQLFVGKPAKRLSPADFMPMTDEERDAMKQQQAWQQQLAAMETLAAIAQLVRLEKA